MVAPTAAIARRCPLSRLEPTRRVVVEAAAGAGFTVPPIVLIPSPTPAGINGSVGGVPATAYATLSAGTVASVSLVNFGAGYAFAPTAVLIPSPYDTALNSITQASIALVLNAANAAKIIEGCGLEGWKSATC